MHRQVALDTETTGLSPAKGERVTEIGCVEIIDRKITGKYYQVYLNPEKEISAGAAAITGLTDDFLRDKPKFIEIVHDFLKFIGDAELIIHNAPFDLGFLNNELHIIDKHAVALESKHNIIDTLVMARAVHKGKNSLDAVAGRYNVDISKRNYHGAHLDAKILAEVYLAMTAGQTSLVFADNDFNEQHMNKIGASVSLQQSTGIIRRASAQELQQHQEYLQFLREQADSCVWDKYAEH